MWRHQPNESIKRQLKKYTALASWCVNQYLIVSSHLVLDFNCLPESFQTKIMLVFALTLWFNTASFLHACPLKGYTGFYFVQNRNMVAGHALEGFTYKEVTTADPMSCFHRCSGECRCISFNIRTTNNTLNCQLNDENRNTKPQALVATPELHYYDLVIGYPPEVKFFFLFSIRIVSVFSWPRLYWRFPR